MTNPDTDPALNKQESIKNTLTQHGIDEGILMDYLAGAIEDPADYRNAERAMKSDDVQRIADDMKQMIGGTFDMEPPDSAMESPFDLAA